jgi:hypothetical protein
MSDRVEVTNLSHIRTLITNKHHVEFHGPTKVGFLVPDTFYSITNALELQKSITDRNPSGYAATVDRYLKKDT